ncbi:MAG: Rieske 2Fe-2S domain-containing protein [Euzebyales bacterium]|jgi:3-phenylpropionate/trans-cinnamate dioxygenase ferredoxin subunit|nr:Rieske 2Fe-2S domain-containing protein [Euzebyales bacterium]
MAFQRVADADQLKVGHALFADLDEPVCVVRLDVDLVKAVHDTCSHEDYPLHEGWVEGNAIECALHGSVFDLDSGAPESLPAVRAIPVYAARIDDDGIWVDTAQQLNDARPPRH